MFFFPEIWMFGELWIRIDIDVHEILGFTTGTGSCVDITVK